MTNEPEWIENNDIGRQAKPCEHYIGWNILEGHSYYRCMNCTYIDGEKSFKEEIEKAKSELLSKIEEEVKGMKQVGLVEKMYQEEDGKWSESYSCAKCGGYDDCDCEGFNEAIGEVIKLLSKYKTL